MNPYLTFAIKAVRRAAAIIMHNFGRLEQSDVRAKGHNDFVTFVDQQAEQEIIRVLSETWPRYGFVGEEGGVHNKDSEYRWLIDPLDGTLNYIHGYPNFSVSVALQHKDVLLAAVVFDPVRDEIFTAARGEGARVNNRRMRVAKVRGLNDSLLVTGFPSRHGAAALHHHHACCRELLPHCQGLRISGSAAMDIVHVAAGRVDGYWQSGLQPWDMAGGALILQESGGLVSDFDGGNDYMRSGNIVCGAPDVHKQLLSVIVAQRSTPSAMPNNSDATHTSTTVAAATLNNIPATNAGACKTLPQGAG